MSGASVRSTRPYLHEIDMLRALTALAVVGVHAVSLTVIFNQSMLGAEVQNGVVSALHFTREVFVSITAMVMVYGYIHKPFDARRFWRKRGLGVLLPFMVWSLFYSWFNVPRHPAGHWLSTALFKTVTGDASYQLYYILLTLEFYLALPLLLAAFRRLGCHPWRLLLGSFAVQLVLLYVDFNYVSRGPFAATQLGQTINTYQWRVLPFYQFYIVLGGLAALHVDRLRGFVREHTGLVVGGGVAGLAVLWLRYLVALRFEHQSLADATAVFQPSMVFYSVGITLFLYGMTYLWTSRRGSTGGPGRFRFWSLISDVSFGIYLIHVFILTQVMRWVVPALPVDWPVALRVVSVYLLVAGGAVSLCTVMLYTPLLSRLIGRPCALKLDWTGTRRRLSRRWVSAGSAPAYRAVPAERIATAEAPMADSLAD